jgi:hypothetical protein
MLQRISCQEKIYLQHEVQKAVSYWKIKKRGGEVVVGGWTLKIWGWTRITTARGRLLRRTTHAY